MNLKKYLSKHFVVRLCLMLALVGAAAAFDIYHSADQKLAGSIRKIPVPDESDSNKIFFCSQLPAFNLRTLGTDFTVRFGSVYTQNKFLLKHYNLRTFQMMKAETVHSFIPALGSFHSLPFNRVLYASPDDTPPLS